MKNLSPISENQDIVTKAYVENIECDVNSVNGKTGIVILDAEDVGALPDTLKSNYDAAYTHSQSTHAPSDAQKNVQSDWNATSGDAFILNKPIIPSAVTENTVSDWGFTKNTGTYIKPTTGIPKTDLASAVQTSLDNADTALQSITNLDLGIANYLPNASTFSGWDYLSGYVTIADGTATFNRTDATATDNTYLMKHTYDILSLVSGDKITGSIYAKWYNDVATDGQVKVMIRLYGENSVNLKNKEVFYSYSDFTAGIAKQLSATIDLSDVDKTAIKLVQLRISLYGNGHIDFTKPTLVKSSKPIDFTPSLNEYALLTKNIKYGTVTIPPTSVSASYYDVTVTFPQPFVTTPVVTATPHLASGGYIKNVVILSVSNASVTLRCSGCGLSIDWVAIGG